MKKSILYRLIKKYYYESIRIVNQEVLSEMKDIQEKMIEDYNFLGGKRDVEYYRIREW